TTLADFALARLTYVIKNLQVYPEKMLENLNLLRGLIFSQRVLLDLVDKGLTREEAYAIVQEKAMQVWKNKSLHFKDLLLKDPQIQKIITQEELENLFDLKSYLNQIEAIFKRVFKE
ncbi:MAG: adenylosuccinate lyase, partial [Caldimicrobium sp.]